MNYPNRGELVVCKIDKIFNYGVNVTLDEYEGVIGFVPLSQVAPRWIKNIRNFVKIGQIKVGKVLSVNENRNQVDISFSVVSSGTENQKLNEWRLTKRVYQLMGLLATKINKNVDDLWDELVNPILEDYDSVYDAFRDIVLYGKDYVAKVPEKYRNDLFEILTKTIIIHEKIINEEIKLTTNLNDGLEKIKNIFKNLPADKEVKCEITYIGNGKYLLRAKSIDFKKIERYLQKVHDYLEKERKIFEVFEIKRVENK